MQQLCPATTSIDSLEGYLLVATSRMNFLYFLTAFTGEVPTIVYANRYVILGLFRSPESFKLVADVYKCAWKS